MEDLVYQSNDAAQEEYRSECIRHALQRMQTSLPTTESERAFNKEEVDGAPFSEDELLTDAADFLPDAGEVIRQNFWEHWRRPVLELLQLYHIYCQDARGPFHKTPLPFDIKERIARKLERNERTEQFLRARTLFRSYRTSVDAACTFSSKEERDSCLLLAQSMISREHKLDESMAALLDLDVMPLELTDFYVPPPSSFTARLLQSSQHLDSPPVWSGGYRAPTIEVGEWLLGVPTEQVRLGFVAGGHWNIDWSVERWLPWFRLKQWTQKPSFGDWKTGPDGGQSEVGWSRVFYSFEHRTCSLSTAVCNSRGSGCPSVFQEAAIKSVTLRAFPALAGAFQTMGLARPVFRLNADEWQPKKDF